MGVVGEQPPPPGYYTLRTLVKCGTLCALGRRKADAPKPNPVPHQCLGTRTQPGGSVPGAAPRSTGVGAAKGRAHIED